MAEAILNVFRGNKDGGETVNYTVPIAPGMVVLDALHYIQGHLSPDLAVRWNCKAGKCGSCSAEVNGRPRLTCKTRMDTLPTHEPITVRPHQDVSCHQRSGDRCFVELQGQQEDSAVPAEKGNGLEVLSGRCGSRAGVPQVHRVFSVPERLPRFARPR